MTWNSGQSGNPKGRPKGAKDKGPRRGSIRAAFLDFLQHRGGMERMADAIETAIKAKGRLSLGYMRLGAQVLDRIDQERKLLGTGTTIVFGSSVDPMVLRMGMPRTGVGDDLDDDERDD